MTLRALERAEPSIPLERPKFERPKSPEKKARREKAAEKRGSGKGKILQDLGLKFSGYICCLYPGESRKSRLHGEGAIAAASTVMLITASAIRFLLEQVLDTVFACC